MRIRTIFILLGIYAAVMLMSQDFIRKAVGGRAGGATLANGAIPDVIRYPLGFKL